MVQVALSYHHHRARGEKKGSRRYDKIVGAGIVRMISTAVELGATYCNANMSILLVTPEEGLPKDNNQVKAM
jgi:hypothetical protein